MRVWIKFKNLFTTYSFYAVVFWFIILSSLSWRNYPIYVDEYASTFLASGICLGCFMGDEVRQFISVNPCDSNSISDLHANNTLANTLKCAARDGGNALIYYGVAHIVAKFVGPQIGLFTSLKLLSLSISLVLLILFLWYLNQYVSSSILLFGGLFFVSIEVPNILFIRTYGLSALCLFVYFMLFNHLRTTRSFDDHQKWKNGVYYVLALLLPFLHFFNVFYLMLTLLYIMLSIYKDKITWKQVVSISIGPVAGIVSLSIFYLFYNEPGRTYQKQLSNYWQAVALNPSNRNYRSTAILTPVNNLKVNTRIVARVFGLKLNQPYYDLRRFTPMHITALLYLIILGFPFFILLSIYRISTKPPFYLLLLFFIFGYLGCLNIMSFILGHHTSLNEQYVFTLFPFSALLLALSFQYLKERQKLFRIIFNLYLMAIMLNALFFAIKPPEVSPATETKPADNTVLKLNQELYLLEQSMLND